MGHSSKTTESTSIDGRISGADTAAVTVRHSSSSRAAKAAERRRFLSGSLAVGATAMLGAASAFAADCDQNRGQVTRCSDGDTGESADPTNCGRCGQESIVPSSRRDTRSRSLPGAYGEQSKAAPGINVSGVKRITD